MENNKKLVLYKIDIIGVITFIFCVALLGSVINSYFKDVFYSREIFFAFLIVLINLLFTFFSQNKAISTNNYVFWGLIMKGIKNLLFIIIIFFFTIVNFFQNNKAFFIFFLGFFLVGFMLELFILNYKKRINN